MRSAGAARARPQIAYGKVHTFQRQGQVLHGGTGRAAAQGAHLFTPSTEPDDGWPNPDPEVSARAAREADRFLVSLGSLEP